MAPKGCAVRGSGARLTPETLALCGSGYSLASSLQTTLTRTHTFSLFLNTPLVPPASRAWLPLLFGASTQADWVFLCSISDGYKLTAYSYALVLVHSLKLPAIILVSDRLTNLPIHPLIHSSSQPQSRRVTHPHTHSAFRCYQRKDLGERLFLCAISLCRGIIFTGDALHLPPAVF